jgi:hypothetical protein
VNFLGLNRCEYAGSDASATANASINTRFGLLLVFTHFVTSNQEAMFS